jgi:hypothetical protein
MPFAFAVLVGLHLQAQARPSPFYELLRFILKSTPENAYSPGTASADAGHQRIGVSECAAGRTVRPWVSTCS